MNVAVSRDVFGRIAETFSSFFVSWKSDACTETVWQAAADEPARPLAAVDRGVERGRIDP